MDTVLIVDNEAKIRHIFKEFLKAASFAVIEAETGEKALSIFKAQPPEVVFLDLEMGDMNGLEILQKLRVINSDIPVIIITAFGNITLSVEAIKNGAYDFIEKPPDFNKLLFILNRAVEKSLLTKNIKKINENIKTSLEWQIGKSSKMQGVREDILRVSTCEIPVMIFGETGTGKTLIARIIHNLSSRSNGPFVVVNMGAIPESLIESELFGYEKGAFTGAETQKKGIFELAHGGTLFLDELESANYHIQSKILVAIEEKRIRKLGGTKVIDVDIRVISATNEDMDLHISEKRFRKDLFYRLNGYPINMPPLRERTEDISFLISKFLEEFSFDFNKHNRGITDKALEILSKHPWNGNIRELKNVIERALLFSNGSAISPEHINLFNVDNKNAIDYSGPLKETSKRATELAETIAIKQSLAETNGNKTKTAISLKINYKTLLNKIKDYKI